MRNFLYFFILNNFLLSCCLAFLEETQAVVSISLNVSQGTLPRGVSLEWSSQWNFTKFDIYRGTSENDLSLFQSNVIQNFWIDEDTMPEIPYFYQILAHNNTGRTIGLSLILSGFRGYPSVHEVKVPEALQASIDKYSDKVELQWVGRSQDWFRIYRTDKKTGSYQRIAETNGFSYHDTNTKPDSSYYYRISSVAMDREYKIVEKFMTGIPQRGSTLYAPTGLSASQNNRDHLGIIRLSWDNDKTVEYYKVYRALHGTENYELIAPFVSVSTYLDYSLPNKKGSYIGSLFQYPQYAYKITAIKNGKESAKSKVAVGSAINPDDILPAPEVNVALDKSTYPYKVNISWSLSELENVFYLLYIKEGNTVRPTMLSTENTSYTIHNEPFGTSVQYIVQAVNRDAGNLPGKEGSVVYQSLTPAPPVIKTISTNARIYHTNIVESTNIQTHVYWYSRNKLRGSMVGAVEKWWTITSTVGFIDLSWEKKHDSEAIDGYNVYRKGPKDTEFKKINKNLLSSQEYRDVNFTLSEYQLVGISYPLYSYKISAVANGVESSLSEISQFGSAINPYDLPKAPKHLGVPYTWSSGTGWGLSHIAKDGPNLTRNNQNISKYAYGIDQVPSNPNGSANFMWLVWEEVPTATHYKVRHSRGDSLEDWVEHNFITDTKKWLNNETAYSDMTGMYTINDFIGYSRESAAFEVTSFNKNARWLNGDTIGILFAEPANRPNGY